MLVACNTSKPPTSFIATTPPLVPALPVLVIRKSEAQVTQPTYTNGQFYCVTNRFGVHCFTWTNPVPYSPYISYGWDFTNIKDNVVFIVGASDDLKVWKRLGIVTNTWFTVVKTNTHTFYRVAASNIVTHFYSGEYL